MSEISYRPANPCVELANINGRSVPATTSLKVSEFFERNHRNVLRDIRDLVAKCSKNFTELNFELSEYTDPTGRKLPMYLLTKDGFMMLAMGYTGARAMRLKEAYIAQFNAMEEALRARPSALPSNYSDALRALAMEVERREALEQRIQSLDSRLQRIENRGVSRKAAPREADFEQDLDFYAHKLKEAIQFYRKRDKQKNHLAEPKPGAPLASIAKRMKTLKYIQVEELLELLLNDKQIYVLQDWKSSELSRRPMCLYCIAEDRNK